MLNELDEIDKKIIELLQKDPQITHEEIAKEINKSQPTVGARILKLLRRGIIGNQYGVNFKSSTMPLLIAQIDASSNNSLTLRAEKCPFVLNILNMTGSSNYILMATASSMEKLNEIVDVCLRRDPTIRQVIPSYVLKMKNDLVLPIHFNMEFYEKIHCSNDCPFKEKKDTIVSRGKSTPIAEKIVDYHEIKIYFDNMIEAIQKFVNCDGIGIRLMDQKGFMPFFSWNGLSEEFIRQENQISLNNCLCGQVCRGEHIEGLSTPFGSLILNSLKSLQGKGAGDLENGIRANCAHEGYRSLALMPLYANNKIIGSLILASMRENAFPQEIVNSLESFSTMIANALITIILDIERPEMAKLSV